MEPQHLAIALFGKNLGTLDIVIYLFGIALLGAFAYILYSYAKGSRCSRKNSSGFSSECFRR